MTASDGDPDTEARLHLLRAQSAAIDGQARHREARPSPVKRLAAWLTRRHAQHDHNVEVRASRRRWRTRRRDNQDWQKHHGGSP